jgi:ABC-type glycerol-3-phosphate transport system substrate-binding protein
MAVIFLLSCSIKYRDPVIIWTNQSEFVSYAELFNTSQESARVVVVYKESPVEAFPPAKDEKAPDIVIGPWLKNERIRKNFMPVDYLFTELQILSSSFYPQLLTLGNVDDKQYLLPVSFNLPAIMFSTKYQDSIPDNYILTTDQIRDTAKTFNVIGKNDFYTTMGFAPQWNESFVYLTAKLNGAAFRENGSSFSWDSNAINNTTAYLQDWSATANTSTTDEADFQFKYLYTPEYKQITSGKCLFSYITSDALFAIPDEQLEEIDFRWIHQNYAIPIEDRIISMGLYKNSKNTAAAEAFMIWFMKESTQKQLLERAVKMNLKTRTFGISGGFSSIRSVNERIFPTFYPALLRNLPPADYLVTPNILPSRWEDIKERVIIPYLLDASKTDITKPVQTLEERLAEWNKQYF